MRDPRLVEIDFLMDVDLKLTLSICVFNGDQTLRYGIDNSRFRDMVIALLSQGYLAGRELRTYGSSNINEGSLAKERNALISDLCARKQIDVVITHLGRVHLWNMRDALLKDPDIEPFGLRSRAAWDRELSSGFGGLRTTRRYRRCFWILTILVKSTRSMAQLLAIRCFESCLRSLEILLDRAATYIDMVGRRSEYCFQEYR
jgi:hypothetical protein